MPNTAQNTALAALAKWPVDNEGTDRLTIVRSIVARSRDLGDALENYNLFLSSLPHYWQEARWQYQAFVDGKIDKHFAEVDKVADETATISQRLADSIDGITKGLSDTLLTTIGAVVASLLAALLAEKTPGAVFEIAMKAYALYLVFLAAYRLGSVGHGYLLLNAETETRLSLYRQQLGVDRVATISAPLRRRRRQFTGWFWATAGLYVALAVTIWIASGQVPREFGRLRIIAPVTPTVNPLVTPTPTHAPATYPRRFGPK